MYRTVIAENEDERLASGQTTTRSSMVSYGRNNILNLVPEHSCTKFNYHANYIQPYSGVRRGNLRPEVSTPKVFRRGKFLSNRVCRSNVELLVGGHC